MHETCFPSGVFGSHSSRNFLVDGDPRDELSHILTCFLKLLLRKLSRFCLWVESEPIELNENSSLGFKYTYSAGELERILIFCPKTSAWTSTKFFCIVFAVWGPYSNEPCWKFVQIHARRVNNVGSRAGAWELKNV